MKVIANIGSTKAIVEVSSEEIALLNGFRSQYDNGCKINDLMSVGTEFNLVKMANTSRFIRTLDATVLQKVRSALTDSMTNLDDAIDEASKLTIFEKLKGDTDLIS